MWNGLYDAGGFGVGRLCYQLDYQSLRPIRKAGETQKEGQGRGRRGEQRGRPAGRIKEKEENQEEEGECRKRSQ